MIEKCGHTKTKKMKIRKQYFGEVFRIKTDVCDFCEATLWDRTTQNEFSKWLNKLDHTKRDRFVIQFSLTKNTLQCLDRLIEDFPGSDRTKVLRALVMFFTDRVAPRKEWSDIVEEITKRDVYKRFLEGKREIVKVHFNPFALLDVLSWAKIADLKPRVFSESVALRIFSFYIEIDPVMHDFWENNIKPEISLILKAA